MTIMEYAIARSLQQLLEASKTRVLSKRETERLERLSAIVEEYRKREEAKGVA